MAKVLLSGSLSASTTVRPGKAIVTSSPLPPDVVTTGAPGRVPPKSVGSTATLPGMYCSPAGSTSTTVRLVIAASGRVTVSR